MATEDPGELAIYLHWPFCEAKCPYCDFNSHVAERVDHARWARAFESEIARAGAETPGRMVSSIYFGGGTPSLMAPATVDRILTAIRATWPLRNSVEITLEANPGSVEAGRFAAYRDAGVNRVSIGFQALNDRDLRALGRIHDTQTALAALDTARQVFSRINFDLIYARQDQSLRDWQAELARALALEPDHLSLYQLTVEDGTAFARRQAAGGLRGLPDEDLAADLYLLTQEMCEAAGLPAYEVSNHARPGEKSRHNLAYWRGKDYLGLGPGAHGRLTLAGRRWATEAPRMPNLWLEQVERTGSGEAPRVEMDAVERAEERILMGLRTTEGLEVAEIVRLLDRTPDARRLQALREDGLLGGMQDRLVATVAGRLVLNSLIREVALAFA